MKYMGSTTAIVAGVGTVLLFALVGGLQILGEEPEPTEVVVDIVASRYKYDPGTDEPIRAKVGQVVVLRLTTTDVTHGLSVEGFPGQIAVREPGDVATIRLPITEAGTYRIFCTVFCGAGHPDHQGSIVVTVG